MLATERRGRLEELLIMITAASNRLVVSAYARNSALFKLVWIAALPFLSACSEVYLKPTASSGETARVVRQCPGPLSVIQFSPAGKPWIHLRVYVEQPIQSRPSSILVIAFEVKVGLGLPYLQWGRSGEFLRRRDHQYELHADSPHIIVTYRDGRHVVLTSQLLSGVHHLQSETVRLASEQIVISDGSVDDFSIELPIVFIDDERIDIPAIHFKLDRATYMPVLNC